jgi:glycosyltransferase involved in cell wall biosynthesis
MSWRTLGSWAARRLGVQLASLFNYPPRPVRLPAHYGRTTPPPDAPTISLVTPSFNQGWFIERTIRSVLDQGYPRLEYVVQDGGSTDETVAILGRYADRLTRWESARDGGQSQAINLGFRHTTGSVMAYLNSDDVLFPGALAYVARYFADHPQVDVLYGHRVLIDETDREVGRWVLPAHDDAVLRVADFVPQETLFWRRRIWDEVGGALDESFRFAMDWDLLLRFLDAGARMARVPRFLGGFRVHAAQKTQHENRVGQEECRWLRVRVHGRPLTDTEIVRGTSGYILRHAALNWLHRFGLLRH